MTEVTTKITKSEIKKVLAWALAICLCMGLTQIPALAAGQTGAAVTGETSVNGETGVNAHEAGTVIKTGKKNGIYTYAKDGTAVFKTAVTTTKKITVPATIKDEKGNVIKVTAIAAGAFKNNKKVETVVVGKNVQKIGKNAFYGCSKLKKVTIGAGVISIGKNAFKGCKKLTTLTVKSTKLTKKGVKKAFKGSCIKTVKAPSKKVKAYKKCFTKKNCGRKVVVKK